MKLFIFFVITLTCMGCRGQSFDRNWVGVAYSPYTDYLPARNWDQYSEDDIKHDLRTIRSYFSSVSTYSMGVASYNRGKNWDQCDSNALIARAAAEVNREGGPKMNVNIGVYQNQDGGDQQREINNAFSAAADANGRSPETVWGITFTNEYINNEGEADQVLQMIRSNKAKANRQGLKVGARTHICGHIAGGNLQEHFRRLARESDYIYCNVYASSQHASLGPSRAAQEVMNYFLHLKSEFQKINPGLEVLIGETGWPSQGNSFNNSPNSVRNLLEYWNAMSREASSKRVKVQLFQAIDEPWKGQGQWKAESHYGLWYKQQNGNRHLVEKRN